MAKKIIGPLRCVLCSKRFSHEDVSNQNFFPDTSTCFDCYNKFAKAPFQGAKGTCFGKYNQITESGKIIGFGYDPIGSTDCSFHCPHRMICPQFASKQIYKQRQFLITPFIGKTAKAMQDLLKGVSRLKAKTVLSDDSVKKDVLRKVYAGKKWVVDRTHKAYKAYFIRIGKRK